MRASSGRAVSWRDQRTNALLQAIDLRLQAVDVILAGISLRGGRKGLVCDEAQILGVLDFFPRSTRW